MDARQEYRGLVWAFRKVTDGVWEESGRCCEKVRDGAPECCYQIVDGADLTFTQREVSLLVEEGVPDYVFQPRDGLWVLDRLEMPPTEMYAALRDGWLADTLECASHPTRPIVVGRTVVGVVLIDGCNAMKSLGTYVRARRLLMGLWQEALDLVGPKPYYVTYAVKPGWIVL